MWIADVTYIRLQTGFVYLVVIIDWHSRYVLDWQISTTLDAYFCLETLGRTLATGKCEIFNTDLGVQFAAAGFEELLVRHGVLIVMDGKSRALDNIFIERLWRSLKYELIHLMELQNPHDVKKN